MNWTLRSDDGTQAMLDIGTVGSVVIHGGFQAPPPAPLPIAADSAVERQEGQAALTARGLEPVADNDGTRFESLYVEDGVARSHLLRSHQLQGDHRLLRGTPRLETHR